MDAILSAIISLLLGGLGVLITAKVIPGFHLRGGFRSAILVGAIYGLLKLLLQKVLIVVSFPLVVLSLGVFIFFINAFLLWLTDKLLERFEVDSVGSLLLGTGLLTLIDFGFQLVLRNGTPF